VVPASQAASAAALHRLRRTLVEEGGFARSATLSSQPARAAQMAGGLALLLALVDELGIDELVPVQAGLRLGVIRDLCRRTVGSAPFRERA
jgi:exopolyphosphatase/guanosine-5'-triphosphate,3'-diphosphate pyrophosphatase